MFIVEEKTVQNTIKSFKSTEDETYRSSGSSKPSISAVTCAISFFSSCNRISNNDELLERIVNQRNDALVQHRDSNLNLLLQFQLATPDALQQLHLGRCVGWKYKNTHL